MGPPGASFYLYHQKSAGLRMMVMFTVSLIEATGYQLI